MIDLAGHDRHRMITPLGAVAAILGGAALLWLSRAPGEAHALAACRRAYSVARTATDTAVADARRATDSREYTKARVTCRTYRLTGKLS